MDGNVYLSTGLLGTDLTHFRYASMGFLELNNVVLSGRCKLGGQCV